MTTPILPAVAAAAVAFGLNAAAQPTVAAQVDPNTLLNQFESKAFAHANPEMLLQGRHFASQPVPAAPYAVGLGRRSVEGPTLQ